MKISHVNRLLLVASACMAVALLAGLAAFPKQSVGEQHGDVAAQPQSNKIAADRALAEKAFYERQLRPFLNKYCFDCHEGETPDSDVRLDVHASVGDLREDRKRWEKAIRMLQSGRMPPVDATQPPRNVKTGIANWLDTTLNYVDCDAPRDPGYVTIRRLNRNEYRNTIRDLLGVDFELSDDFPADDVGYGFDTVGDVLSLPPILMEKYLAAAERVTDQALAQLQPAEGPSTKYAGSRLRGEGRAQLSGDAWRLTSAGEIVANHKFPAAGAYTIRIRAEGDQAGDEPVRMGLMIDGRQRHEFKIESQGKIELREHVLTVEPGTRRVGAAFLNDYYRPEATNPADRDRNMAVHEIEIVGPRRKRTAEEAAAARKVFFVNPSDQTTARDAASQILRTLASRAFRRAATDDEVSRLVDFWQTSFERKKDFHASVALALQAILVSPQFLFKVELDPDPSDPLQVRLLDDFELATRMSYFLWSTMPDDELFRQARAGTLRQNLDTQIRRMIRDPRSQALAENFATQWLGLRDLEMMEPDGRRFPQYNERLRDAMLRESVLFFDAIVREDRSVLDLIDADFTFANDALAKHYGLTGVSGNDLQRVTLDERSARGGVLTQASVLLATSNPTRTSPVKRGKWILENILGTPPPDPPPNVPELEESDEAIEAASLRERLEQHRADANCAVCHEQMDALGFAMENFNVVGAWREKDGRFAIDPSGTLPDGQQFAGPTELRRLLRTQFQEEFLRCLTEKTLTYALWRGVEYYDRCTVDEICEAVAENDLRISTLFIEIVRSEPFQKRRGKDG